MKNMQRRIKELNSHKLEVAKSKIVGTDKVSPMKQPDESLRGVSFREYLRSIRINN